MGGNYTEIEERIYKDKNKQRKRAYYRKKIYLKQRY